MLHFRIVVLSTYILPLVRAQASVSLSSLPECARTAATAGLTKTSCSLTDVKCICSATAFISSLTTAVQNSCSSSEQQATLAFAQTLCGSQGIQLNVPGASAAADTADTAAAPASSPTAAAPSANTDVDTGTDTDTDTDSETESKVAASAPAEATVAASSLPTTPLPTTTGSYTANSTGNLTVAVSSPVPFTGSATFTPKKLQWVGAALVGVVGMFFAL
ncbi:MAG: hypothetical protein Q9214_003372 [Letrouitia sp. 1 TL-2023]